LIQIRPEVVLALADRTEPLVDIDISAFDRWIAANRFPNCLKHSFYRRLLHVGLSTPCAIMKSLEHHFGAGSLISPVGSCQDKFEYSWQEVLETVQVAPDLSLSELFGVVFQGYLA
jgi:hypothetical protein